MNARLSQALGLPSAIAIVMGSMIGSGIFIVSADIARTVNSPGLLILAWLVTGVLTLIAALSYGELAAMMPHAGGQYIFLREALGPLWGFLYGWTLFLVIQTGTIAAVAVAFGKFLGVIFSSISASHWIVHFGSVGLNTQNLVAISIIALLTLINIFGVRSGAFVQNIMTVTKTLALAALILVGFTFAFDLSALNLNYENFWNGFSWNAKFTADHVGIFTVIAIVQVGSLFSADAWNNVTFTAAEVKNPHRNLPLALVLGTGGVILLYVLANFAYLMALPISAIQNASEDRVATAVLAHAFGHMGSIAMALAIMVSTFGCVNGMVLAGARVYYAMSIDKLFFRSVGQIHPKYKTPVVSLIVQGIWAALLCLSGTYGQLLDYVVFAAVLFYILTILSLFILRRKKPDLHRPYRAIGYPWLPILYIVIALFIEWALLCYKPQFTWPGLIIVASGIPVYFLTSDKTSRRRKEN